MKYIDGFRNPGAADALRDDIASLAEKLPQSGQPGMTDLLGEPASTTGVPACPSEHRDTKVRTTNIMEVCGSHTMAIARYGIRDLLPANVNLISGPGCPVCVTDTGYIDAAIELARRGLLIVTFGDMLNVPGSETSLAAARSEGLDIETSYSPTHALELAREHPDREIVFLAIGFETTVAPTMALLEEARREGIQNLTMLIAFKLVPPALQALMTDPDLHIDAFLCPAHVSAIIGADAYAPFTGEDGVPCVIAGFEPLDILLGLKGVLEQLVNGKACVENQYGRVVRQQGNQKAQDIMARFLKPADVAWRGIGVIPKSGLVLREKYAEFDAEKRHAITIPIGEIDPACRCGDVIKGIAGPFDCPMFGTVCTPSDPVGPCMVSSEGSCAAYYKYSR